MSKNVTRPLFGLLKRLISESTMPRVSVSEGLLNGKKCSTYYGKKYYSFEGIPYAKPPVGKLRFRNPEPPEKWTGIRDATKPGNKSCQINPYLGTGVDGSEDCLYLNVYTPTLPQENTKKLPVLFFVHGGRFLFGYGHYYTPDYLLKNDVILVTCNYRLNIFGFLCLNIPEAPGNVALKDTVFALRWVKQNIEYFNGDADNITVMGESAGASIVTAFMTSKMAEGLFHKVIALSGNSVADLFMIDEDHVEKAKVVASYLGKEDFKDEREVYDFLVDAPVSDLLMASSAAELNRHPGILNAFFTPNIEKDFENVEPFFTRAPRADFFDKKFAKVPFLSGINSHEGALFLRRDEKGNINYIKDLFYYIPRYLYLKKGSEKAAAFERRIKNLYFGGKEINDSLKEEYVNLISDAHFNKELIFLPEILSKVYDDVYFYQFKYFGNLHTRVMKSLGLKGASHGDMMQYQFYRKNKHSKCSKSDLEIIDFLSESLCNFAKTGKPTWSNQKTEWLPYLNEQKNVLVIDDEIKMDRDVYSERMKFWLDAVLDKSKL